MAILLDRSADSLHSFMTAHVEPSAREITDGRQGYRGIDKLDHIHPRRSGRAARRRGEDIGGLRLSGRDLQSPSITYRRSMPAVDRPHSLCATLILVRRESRRGTEPLFDLPDQWVFAASHFERDAVFLGASQRNVSRKVFSHDGNFVLTAADEQPR